MRHSNIDRIIVLIGVCGLLVAGVGAAEEPVDRSLPEYTGTPAPELAPWTGLEGGGLGMVGVIDDFNRPDGPLGADWTVQAVSLSIVSEAATGTNMALATHNSATGDRVEIDVMVNPIVATQYAAAVLNFGGGVTNIFIKVQNNGGGTVFDWGGCYTGNNNSGATFGLGFFSLSETFSSARMAVSVDAGRTVTIDLTNIDGGALADQQYICTGAPPAEGPALGIGTFGNNDVRIDNFGDGPIPVELMTFSVE